MISIQGKLSGPISWGQDEPEEIELRYEGGWDLEKAIDMCQRIDVLLKGAASERTAVEEMPDVARDV